MGHLDKNSLPQRPSSPLGHHGSTRLAASVARAHPAGRAALGSQGPEKRGRVEIGVPEKEQHTHIIKWVFGDIQHGKRFEDV